MCTIHFDDNNNMKIRPPYIVGKAAENFLIFILILIAFI